MLAFTLTLDQTILFYEICQEINAVTEDQRMAVLNEMAKCGQVKSIVSTPKTKEEYIKHLAKNFKVLKIGDSKQ